MGNVRSNIHTVPPYNTPIDTVYCQDAVPPDTLHHEALHPALRKRPDVSNVGAIILRSVRLVCKEVGLRRARGLADVGLLGAVRQDGDLPRGAGAGHYRPILILATRNLLSAGW